MSIRGNMANYPDEYPWHSSKSLVTPPDGEWPERGWVEAPTWIDFWRNENISMPLSRPIPVVSTSSSLSIAAETMYKMEPMEFGWPSVVRREQTSQRTGGCRVEQRSARPEPMKSEHTPPLIIEDLPRLEYQVARQSSMPRFVSFRVAGATKDGFPLRKAFDNDLDTLEDGNESSPFQSASAKVSIRLHFAGCESYSRQIMARNSTAGSKPISMKVLAHKISREMHECLWKTQVAGKPLLHRGQFVQLENLSLCRLTQVSPGSWVPEFEVTTRISG